MRAKINVRSLGRAAVATAVMAVAGIGITTSAPEAEAFPLLWPPIACPMIYAPVICDGGYIYDNECFAEAYGATGCVPWDWFGL